MYRVLLRISILSVLPLIFSSTLADAQHQKPDPDRVACEATNPKTVYGEITPSDEDFFTKWIQREDASKQNMKCFSERSAARAKEELRKLREQREEAERKRQNLQRAFQDLRSALAEKGPIFEFTSVNNAWGHHHRGCLVGANSTYSYNFGDGYSLDAIAKPDAPALANAIALAKAVLGQELQTTHVRFDAGELRWTATIENKTVLLKETGVMEGELLDSKARELVIIINRWCPDAAQVFAWSEADRNPRFERVVTANPEQARAMLERAIAELQENEAAALEKFGKVIWRDLYVFCATSSGELVAHRQFSLPGQQRDALKQQWAQKFKAAVEQATEHTITEFDYFDLGFSKDRSEVPKGAFLKKVAELVCGVGYFKDSVHYIR